MKRIGYGLLFIILGAMLLIIGNSFDVTSLQAQNENQGELTEAGASESEYEWVLIEPFDDCANWAVVNADFTREEYYTYNPVMTIFPNVPKALENTPDADPYCLGMKIDVPNLASQPLEILPRESIYLEKLSNRVYMGGPISRISMWVNGRNLPLQLRAYIQNAPGTVFSVYLGNVQHWGWKRLEGSRVFQQSWGGTTADFRLTDIPQPRWDDPTYRPMRIIKFQLINPMSIPFTEERYIYWDRLMVKMLMKTDSPPDADIGGIIYNGELLPEEW